MEGLPFTDTFGVLRWTFAGVAHIYLLGVMLIGSFIAMGVYGITTLQVSSRHPCSTKHAPLLPPRIMH